MNVPTEATRAEGVLQRFHSEDGGFVDALRRCHDPEALARLAEVWRDDDRPWARRAWLEYLQQPLDCPGHRPLIKRLFKAAEERDDVEWMAAFLVALDGCVRRSPETGRAKRDELLFTHRTRYYLRRRAWRFFRRLGFQRPAEYCPAAAEALVLYRDESLQSPWDVLDSWGLLHIGYGESEALRFGASKAHLQPGRRLEDLQPAPCFPELWQTESGAAQLARVAGQGQAWLVRRWAGDLLAQSPPNIVAVHWLPPLVDHPDEHIRRTGWSLLDLLLSADSAAAWRGVFEARGKRCLPAIARLRELLTDRPGEAEALAPPLTWLVCSGGAMQRRAAISALMTAVEQRPELATMVERLAPQIQIVSPTPA